MEIPGLEAGIYKILNLSRTKTAISSALSEIATLSQWINSRSVDEIDSVVINTHNTEI